MTVRRLPPFLFLGIALVLTAPSWGGSERLTCRPRPTPAAVKRLPVGAEVRTGIGQHRRLALADGSALYLNEQTTIKLTVARRLKLSAGEVFIEAAPGETPFVVATARREVSAAGTAFAVRASDKGTGVLVARGLVKVSGLDKPLLAGQRLLAGRDKAETAPRASHALAWVRELMASAEPALVPTSAHTGGSLSARGGDGQEVKLSLRKYHIDVHIEDGFARTTIDETYFNHQRSRLEGTFRFPLPADASLSRLAMYVDGTRMEGGMVERDHGRNVYESIVERQKDPALLEWVDGTTFRMRVFPLEPRQEKRILLSYTQKLPALYGEATYRFAAGHSLGKVGLWSFHARITDGAAVKWRSPSHALKATRDKGDLLLDATEKDAKLERDMVLTLAGEGPAGAARFSSAEQDGARYLMVRYRPDLAASERRQRRDWVFLFESSGDRDPLLARAQVEIIRALLHNADPGDTFAILAAGNRVKLWARQPQPVTPSKVQQAVAFLEETHLIGALNLEKALAAAAPLLKAGKEPYLVHLGSGIAAMGEQRQEELVQRVPKGVRYVGIGVGRRWDRALMKAAAERSGGYFTQVNPDEPVAWRAFELSATLNAPRLLDIRVSDGGNNRYLTFTSLAAHGEEVCAVTRLDATAKLPTTLTVRGTLDGRPFEQELAVKDVADKAAYLPRTWAKLEIERLLAEDALKHKKELIELSKAMVVMTPFTSLLVLESEAMYQQYKVERGRKDHWALYDCPDKIPVFSEDEDGNRIDPRKNTKPTPKQVLDTVLWNSPPSTRDHSREEVIPLAAFRLTKMTAFRLRKASSARVAQLVKTFWAQRSSSETNPIRVIYEGSINTVFVEASPADMAEIQRLIWGIDNTTSNAASEVRLEQLRDSRDEFAWKTLQDTGVFGPDNVTISDPIRFDQERSARAGKRMGQDAVSHSQLRSYPDLRFTSEFDINGIGMGTENRTDPIMVGLQKEDLRQLLSPAQRLLGITLLGSATVNSIKGAGAFGGGYGRRDDRLFFDLVSYAPGMSSSRADLLAVLEAETASFDKPGRIDDGARRLLAKARPDGWQTLQLPAEGDAPALRIAFDGSGHYAYERTLPPGIRERVVCDGKTLRHLYPDLHIGARRSVSRFHRLDFARLVPWSLLRAGDLAHGADVKLAGKRTVAIVPHGAEAAKDKDGKALPYAALHFLFDEDGRLSEQRLIEMPAKKVLVRILLGADGTLKVLGAKDKELLVRKGKLAPAQAPNLTPDVNKLVVLSLPCRSREHVLKVRKLEGKSYGDMPFEDALALFGSAFAAGDGNEALKVFREGFHGRDRRGLGFYVLLAACGQNLDAQNADVLSEHPDEPLAQYLALHSSPVLRKHASQWAAGSASWGEGFLRHLAVTHALLQRWQDARILGRTSERRQGELKRAADYVRRHKDSGFGLALLVLMQQRTNEQEDKGKDVRGLHATLAELWPLYGTRYEEARSLWKSGKREQGRQRFLALYAETFKRDALLVFDADFRKALQGSGMEKDLWSPLLRHTAKELVQHKRRPAVLLLARQCGQVEDRTLARDLLSVALDGITDNKERLRLTVAAIELLRESNQLIEADRLLAPLLADAELSKHAALWRLAADLAAKRQRTARELECLERALDAEYHNLPEVINVRRVDEDYGKLLTHYQHLAEAMVTLKVLPPADFLPKVVRAADRWRSLGNGTTACEAAAQVLRQLGERELAWDYLTTPVGLRPKESGPWAALAERLRKQGDFALADEALASAVAAEPTNAQLLWDRARNLGQAGRREDARKLLRHLVDGTWQPRFAALKKQAQWQLGR